MGSLNSTHEDGMPTCSLPRHSRGSRLRAVQVSGWFHNQPELSEHSSLALEPAVIHRLGLDLKNHREG